MLMLLKKLVVFIILQAFCFTEVHACTIQYGTYKVKLDKIYSQPHTLVALMSCQKIPTREIVLQDTFLLELSYYKNYRYMFSVSGIMYHKNNTIHVRIYDIKNEFKQIGIGVMRNHIVKTVEFDYTFTEPNKISNIDFLSGRIFLD